jgi:hypothetical protein
MLPWVSSHRQLPAHEVMVMQLFISLGEDYPNTIVGGGGGGGGHPPAKWYGGCGGDWERGQNYRPMASSLVSTLHT